MLIEGKLATYNAEYVTYGITYAKVILKLRKKQWYGLYKWVRVYESAETYDLDEMGRMYPNIMLEIFVEHIKEYEDYIIQWDEFNDIQAKGSKLKVV